MTPFTVACPCGGHAVTLPPDMPPLGGRAAFTCPACGKRVTFTRTRDGAVFSDPGADRTLPEAPPAPAPIPIPDIAPVAVPPGARVAFLALADPGWLAAAGTLAAVPDWLVIPADPDPARAVAALRANPPELAIIENRPEAAPLLTEIDALPGRRRERLVLILIGDAPDGDPLAAFAAGADAVLDRRDARDAAGRLAAALTLAGDRPSLFGGG